MAAGAGAGGGEAIRGRATGLGADRGAGRAVDAVAQGGGEGGPAHDRQGRQPQQSGQLQQLLHRALSFRCETWSLSSKGVSAFLEGAVPGQISPSDLVVLGERRK